MHVVTNIGWQVKQSSSESSETLTYKF